MPTSGQKKCLHFKIKFNADRLWINCVQKPASISYGCLFLDTEGARLKLDEKNPCTSGYPILFDYVQL